MHDIHPGLIDQLAAFHQDAFGWAATCSGGDADAGADALREAYVKVATGRAKFAARSSLKTWWFAVVRLTALERRRGQQRWRRIAEVFQEWMAGLNEGTPKPDEELAMKPDSSQLQAALVKRRYVRAADPKASAPMKATRARVPSAWKSGCGKSARRRSGLTTRNCASVARVRSRVCAKPRNRAPK